MLNVFKANEFHHFDTPHRWIIFCEDGCIDSLREFDISINSDISLCRTTSNKTVVVEKIFKYEKIGELIFEDWGYWRRNENFLSTQVEKNLFRRRNNFRNISLNTCIVVTNNNTLKHLTDKR